MGGYTLPRMNMQQVLGNKRDRSVRYHAVILDPESGKRLAVVPIYRAGPGEYVDLSIETETVDD